MNYRNDAATVRRVHSFHDYEGDEIGRGNSMTGARLPHTVQVVAMILGRSPDR